MIAPLTPARRWQLAAVVVALAVVVVGKQAYRDATAADLRWILAPTARLVAWVTGARFGYDPAAGYVDADLGFIIAPPCAGVNFALAAFLALALGGLPAMTSARATATRLVGAAGLAFMATLIVNTVRIAIAIAIHRGSIDLGGHDRALVHEQVGIAVYLGGLCGLYAVARAAGNRRRHVGAA